jgi:hypothetical protein
MQKTGMLESRRHLIGAAAAAAAAVAAVAIVALSLVPVGDARGRPECFGKTATIVGTNGSDVIDKKLTAGTDVVAAEGGDDVIAAEHTRRNNGEDIYCGGGGHDRITGNNKANTLIGGPGHDKVKAGPGNDLVVGDNANPEGSETGKTGRDHLNGAGDKDFVVGDNYASGNATGGSSDKDVFGLDGPDTVIGDSASTDGDASGGGHDRVAGADGDDLVVGDSWAPNGTASGSGDESGKKGSLNGGPDNDLLVGDNYTNDGTTSGGGDDHLQGLDGGDAGARCKGCDDVFYGDNYSASCGPKATPPVIECQALMAPGGGVDRLTPDQGDDFMNGGPPDDPDLRGDGDVCSGGTDRDTGTRCELYVHDDTEHVIQFP